MLSGSSSITFFTLPCHDEWFPMKCAFQSMIIDDANWFCEIKKGKEIITSDDELIFSMHHVDNHQIAPFLKILWRATSGKKCFVHRIFLFDNQLNNFSLKFHQLLSERWKSVNLCDLNSSWADLTVVFALKLSEKRTKRKSLKSIKRQ